MALAKTMKKLGRYDLVRELGKGAMGLVYEGRDPNLDRRVAIKTIKVENLTAQEAADYEVRFRTEARSAARLQHPHIVTVYDSDRDGDVAFLVMEFIDGDDLKQHLDRGEVYTLAQTLGLMGDLLSAMDYAHRQGVVHRDIKPANLLLERSGRVKLTDFGVARIQDSGDATRTQGSMVGTLKYMSPEQVQGHVIDARSDLFAAGVVLYQLLTSKRPFNGSTDFEVIQSIVGQDPPPPSSITPGLPPALDAVVARALQKSKDARYATAQEFHTALVASIQTANDQTIAPAAKAIPTGRVSFLSDGLPPFDAKPESSSGSSSSTVTQEVELVYWKDIKDSNDRDELEGFLRRFPRGIYADLARRKLKRLGTWGSDGSGSGDSAFGATLLMPRGTAPMGNDEETIVAPSTPVPNDSAPTQQRRRAWVWGAGAVLIVAVAVVGMWLARAPVPEPQMLTERAADSAPLKAPSSAPAAPMITETAPTVPVEPPAVVPVAPKPKPKLTAEHVSPKQATATKTPAPAPAKSSDPLQTCEGRWLLSYQICMSQECAKPQFMQLPVCLERKAQERRSLERNGY